MAAWTVRRESARGVPVALVMVIGLLVVLNGLAVASIRDQEGDNGSIGAGPASSTTTSAPVVAPAPTVPATIVPPRSLVIDQRELIVYMQPSATEVQVGAVRRRLERMTDLQSVRFVGKGEAYEEMKVLFAETPEVITAISVEDAPVNFHVVPRPGVDRSAVGARLKGYKGVLHIAYPERTGPRAPFGAEPAG